MQKLTGFNLVSFINQLPKNRDYNYINPATKEMFRIVCVALPQGPISIKRWNPCKKETAQAAKPATISTEMIWRVANAFTEDQPFNMDRILGASYNTRSVLESLIALTPDFYYCYPGRISDINGVALIKKGHKHLLWVPGKPHDNGIYTKIETKVAESEIPTSSVFYDSLNIPQSVLSKNEDMNALRRHTQIQIALYLIGKQFGYDTWIAQNDKGIVYAGKALLEHDGVIKSLDQITVLNGFPGSQKAASFIDSIWFGNDGGDMPAVMEVEHTTGVNSGLLRMKELHDKMKNYKTKFIIVAPDEARAEVFNKSSEETFSDLGIQYFPYSSVEELFSLCQRRKLHGVTDDFIDCFTEPISGKK